MVLHNSVLHMNMMNNLACILCNLRLCCYLQVYTGPNMHLIVNLVLFSCSLYETNVLSAQKNQFFRITQTYILV